MTSIRLAGPSSRGQTTFFGSVSGQKPFIRYVQRRARTAPVSSVDGCVRIADRARHPSGSSSSPNEACALAAWPPQKNVGTLPHPKGFHRTVVADVPVELRCTYLRIQKGGSRIDELRIDCICRNGSVPALRAARLAAAACREHGQRRVDLDPFAYDPNGKQTGGLGRSIGYASYNKPASITPGARTIGFLDGTDHQRIKLAKPGYRATPMAIRSSKRSPDERSDIRVFLVPARSVLRYYGQVLR